LQVLSREMNVKSTQLLFDPQMILAVKKAWRSYGLDDQISWRCSLIFEVLVREEQRTGTARVRMGMDAIFCDPCAEHYIKYGHG